MAGASRPAIWSSEALLDLAGIWDYYEHVAGGNTAEKIVREIEQVREVLEEHPLAGRPRHNVRPGLRSIPASRHIIFYLIKNDFPHIVRLLDERQDIDAEFADSEGRS